MTAALAACSSDGGASDAVRGSSSGTAGLPTAERAAPRPRRARTAATPRAGRRQDRDTGATGGATSARRARAARRRCRVERHVISTGTVSLISDDVREARRDVQRVVDASRRPGLRGETETDEDGDPVYARLVMRVPAGSFADAMTALEGVADLRGSDRTSEDVSTQVIDTDVRVRAQEASLRRVEQLLARAQGLKDIIWIESQLTSRQAELDSLKGQQAWLADQTRDSTIVVDISRTPEDEPREEEADAGFLAGLGGGMKALGAVAVGLATIVGALLPFAVVLAVLGLPVWLRRTPLGTAPTSRARRPGPVSRVRSVDHDPSSSVRIAVLIDADNTSPKYAEALLEELAKYGTPTIKRAYGDFSSQRLSGWTRELNARAIRAIHQNAFTVGKNSTDSALIIDAMDLLYAGNVEAFALVSSDSDFTGLALRLRESGKIVYGLGRQRTPQSLQNACDRFIALEVLGEEPAEAAAERADDGRLPRRDRRRRPPAQPRERPDAGGQRDRGRRGLEHRLLDRQPPQPHPGQLRPAQLRPRQAVVAGVGAALPGVADRGAPDPGAARGPARQGVEVDPGQGGAGQAGPAKQAREAGAREAGPRSRAAASRRRPSSAGRRRAGRAGRAEPAAPSRPLTRKPPSSPPPSRRRSGRRGRGSRPRSSGAKQPAAAGASAADAAPRPRRPRAGDHRVGADPPDGDQDGAEAHRPPEAATATATPSRAGSGAGRSRARPAGGHPPDPPARKSAAPKES